MKKLLMLGLLLFAGSVNAAVIEFVPPNDPDGRVFTTNSNDGWFDGRGVVFQATEDGTISSIGVFHDLTGETLSYTLSQVTSAVGDIETGETILASGSTVVNTNGLEWIDFPIANVPYTAGNFYHIEFDFPGAANQNFFYDNDDVSFTQDSFEVIDGTSGGDTGNTVMPAIRMEFEPGGAAPAPGPAVPVPSLSVWGMLLLLMLFGFIGARSARRTALSRD